MTPHRACAIDAALPNTVANAGSLVDAADSAELPYALDNFGQRFGGFGGDVETV